MRDLRRGEANKLTKEAKQLNTVTKRTVFTCVRYRYRTIIHSLFLRSTKSLNVVANLLEAFFDICFGLTD